MVIFSFLVQPASSTTKGDEPEMSFRRLRRLIRCDWRKDNDEDRQRLRFRCIENPLRVRSCEETGCPDHGLYVRAFSATDTTGGLPTSHHSAVTSSNGRILKPTCAFRENTEDDADIQHIAAKDATVGRSVCDVNEDPEGRDPQSLSFSVRRHTSQVTGGVPSGSSPRSYSSFEVRRPNASSRICCTSSTGVPCEESSDKGLFEIAQGERPERERN